MGKDKKKEEAVFLRKKITLLRAFSLLIGSMVGSGIFISPKGVLKNSGTVGFSLVVWFACGLLSMFGALCYAELGTRITKSGGHYIYILETLGPLPSFLFLWAEFFAIRPANSAVVSLAFGRYLLEPFFAPCAAPIPAVKLVSLLGYYAVLTLNSWSVTWSARLQTALSIVKLLALMLIIVPGMMLLAQEEQLCKTHHSSSASWCWPRFISSRALLGKLQELATPKTSRMLLTGSRWFQISCPWLFMQACSHIQAGSRPALCVRSWSDPNGKAGEVDGFCTSLLGYHCVPKHQQTKQEEISLNIPLAVIVSVITVIVGYMLTNISYYTALGTQDVLASPAVAVSFVQQACTNLISVVPVLVALSCFGTMNGGILTFSRCGMLMHRAPCLFLGHCLWPPGKGSGLLSSP
ncbi:cystine/glutamate transporter-like isoform X3 [Tympanuchus pallidicinctus]|uniref:cystine/glutamate transporter-like isoform X3 n=1 Tax=Tympanuchus pallidicinctus TaxID=109042 RepID=UPI002286ECF6|nr:cystine/glutamate transporter-like isoform X3 [Tympanuchus pallidicinctus]